MDDLKNAPLAQVDPLIAEAIDNEVARQANGLELIASENFVTIFPSLFDCRGQETLNFAKASRAASSTTRSGTFAFRAAAMWTH